MSSNSLSYGVCSSDKDGVLGASASISTRGPQTRVGAIETFIIEGTARKDKENPESSSNNSVHSQPPPPPYVDARSVIAASKFATPITPTSLVSEAKSTASSLSVASVENKTSVIPPKISQNGFSSRTALQHVEGQVLYSGRVKYEPPPLYHKSVTLNSKPFSNYNSTNNSVDYGAGISPSDCNCNDIKCKQADHAADVIIQPHSLSKFEIHTYENVRSGKPSQVKYSESAAVIIENKHANSRPSSISSQESKHSSPHDSLVRNFKNYSHPKDIKSENRVKSYVEKISNNNDKGSIDLINNKLNSSINLKHLPPRIEQDLEGRQFVIPRNNAYVEENARHVNQWSLSSDSTKHKLYCDQVLPNKGSASPCCLSPHSHLASPSHLSLHPPPPPYPGKPPSISSLSSSIDLNDSVLSLGSLRSASGVLASVNANHNYANIDVLKGNYIADQQLEQYIQHQDKLHHQQKSSFGRFINDSSSIYPVPSRPYLSSSAHEHLPSSTGNRLPCGNRGGPGYTNNRAHLPNELANLNSATSSNSSKNYLGSHLNQNESKLPPPPPYPSTVVRSQLLYKNLNGTATSTAPPLPPYPSTALRHPVPLVSKSSFSNQIKLRAESPSICKTVKMEAVKNSSSVTQGVVDKLADLKLTPEGEQSPSERLTKWQNRLNPSYEANTSVSAGAKSSTATSSSAGDVSDASSDKSASSSSKTKSKHSSGKSLLPYNVTAKSSVSIYYSK